MSRAPQELEDSEDLNRTIAPDELVSTSTVVCNCIAFFATTLVVSYNFQNADCEL